MLTFHPSTVTVPQASGESRGLEIEWYTNKQTMIRTSLTGSWLLKITFLLELLTSKLRAISDQLMLKCLPLCTLLGPTRTSVRDRPKFSLENSTFFHLFYWHQKQAPHDKITHTSSFSLSLTSNTANFKRVISFTVPSGNTTVVRKYGSIFC